MSEEEHGPEKVETPTQGNRESSLRPSHIAPSSHHSSHSEYYRGSICVAAMVRYLSCGVGPADESSSAFSRHGSIAAEHTQLPLVPASWLSMTEGWTRVGL